MEVCGLVRLIAVVVNVSNIGGEVVGLPRLKYD